MSGILYFSSYLHECESRRTPSDPYVSQGSESFKLMSHIVSCGRRMNREENEENEKNEENEENKKKQVK